MHELGHAQNNQYQFILLICFFTFTFNWKKP